MRNTKFITNEFRDENIVVNKFCNWVRVIGKFIALIWEGIEVNISFDLNKFDVIMDACVFALTSTLRWFNTVFMD